MAAHGLGPLTNSTCTVATDRLEMPTIPLCGADGAVALSGGQEPGYLSRAGYDDRAGLSRRQQ
jgi:hypothetical protein